MLPPALRRWRYRPLQAKNDRIRIIIDDQLNNQNPDLIIFFGRSGEPLTAAVNHFKSKGSPCTGNISPVGPDPDLGDGQGNCNLTRTVAAHELVAWLATDPTAISDPDALTLGDLNAYAREDPIAALAEAGFTDLLESQGYTFAFSGQWGSLDAGA